MLKYGIAALILVTATGTLGAQSDSDRFADRSRSDRILPQERIHNRVLDLLDEPVVLDSTTETVIWQSRPFDTSQYTRAGVRVATEPGSDPVSCNLWWQFTADEAFLPGPATPPGFVGDDTRLEPVASGPLVFSSIFGLRARAVCRLVAPDFGQVPPPTVSAVVSDVKVLLRRE